MKLAPAPAAKFRDLLARLDARFRPETPPPADPVTTLVIAFLQWESTAKGAQRVFEALMAELVDINELRVSHTHELITALGDDDPLAGERLARLREALNEVYIREYAVKMGSVADKPKKDQRHYLNTLPGIMPYAAASVMLLSFEGHAMPVDGKLVALLSKEGILEPDTPAQQAEDALLKEVKAADALRAHLLLQAWSDSRKRPDTTRGEAKKAPRKKPTSKKASTKKTPAKKTPPKKAPTKKAPTKKPTTKKSAAKKPTAKKPAAKKPAASGKTPAKKSTPARKK